MDDFLKQALEIAKAQAGVRAMTAEQVMAYAKELANGIRDASSCVPAECAEPEVDVEEAKKSIKEKSVTCLVCGKSFKMLGKKHLATHGFTPAEYKAHFGLKKGTALVCKELVRARRKKMNEMELWRRREGAGKAEA